MQKKILIGCLCAIFALLIVGRAWAGMHAGPHIDEQTLYKVTYVADGDTFMADIEGYEITVRVLGVNTPEVKHPKKPAECYGSEASEETKKLLLKRSVRLVANPGREAEDKYGRYLMYVYRDDGLFLNEHLLKNGFAREFLVGKPYEKRDEFLSDQAGAKSAHAGLWGQCDKKK